MYYGLAYYSKRNNNIFIHKYFYSHLFEFDLNAQETKNRFKPPLNFSNFQIF